MGWRFTVRVMDIVVALFFIGALLSVLWKHDRESAFHFLVFGWQAFIAGKVDRLIEIGRSMGRSE